MKRTINPVNAIAEARRKAAVRLAAKLWFAVNLGHWDRNTAPLEISLPDGVADLSRGSRSQGTAINARGQDTRGGVLREHRAFTMPTTAGEMQFVLTVSVARYEWTAFMARVHEHEAWLHAALLAYLGRVPRYLDGSEDIRPRVINPDYGSAAYGDDRVKVQSPYLAAPDLEDSRYSVQLAAWLCLETRLPLGCFALTQRLQSALPESVGVVLEDVGKRDRATTKG
jgi:hypothetical protein